jgi:hypothetical protein
MEENDEENGESKKLEEDGKKRSIAQGREEDGGD